MGGKSSNPLHRPEERILSLRAAFFTRVFTLPVTTVGTRVKPVI